MPAVNHELLRRRRDELDLSNPDLAARMQTSLRYVENIVSGADNPGWRVIYKLSRALGLPVEKFVPNAAPPPSTKPKVTKRAQKANVA